MFECLKDTKVIFHWTKEGEGALRSLPFFQKIDKVTNLYEMVEYCADYHKISSKDNRRFTRNYGYHPSMLNKKYLAMVLDNDSHAAPWERPCFIFCDNLDDVMSIARKYTYNATNVGYFMKEER